MRRLFRFKQVQRGDTIVEVLISMSILALVLVASFAASSRSLHTGTDATNRQQALALAQQQIEIIKNDVSLNNISKYTSQPAAQQLHFCVGSDNLAYDSSNSKCQFLSQYQISNSLQNGLFTVNTNWTGSGSGGQSQLAVYFRIPDPDSITQSVAPTVSLSVLAPCNNPVGAGQSCTLQWAVTNSTSCTASGGWSGSKTASPNGTYTQAVTFSGTTTTYTLTCQNGGTSVSSSVTVNSNVMQFNFCVFDNYFVASCSGNSPSSVTTYYGNSASLKWSISNANSCSSTGFAGPTGNGTGTVTTSGLTNTTNTYQINCTGLSGSNQSLSVTVNIPPPPTSPSQSCSANGTPATISWTKAAGYASNYVRTTEASSGIYQYPPTSEDYLNNSSTWTSTPGMTYNWWVHTRDPSNGAWSNTVGGTFVCPIPAPTASISASPNPIAYGASSTITWGSTNTGGGGCLLNGSSWVGTSGSTGTGALYSNTGYSVSCYNSVSTWSSPASVTVSVGGPPTVTSFYASPSSIAYGAATTLYWSSSNTSGGGCLIEGLAWVGTSGSTGTGARYSNTTYQIHCYNSSGVWGGSSYTTVNVGGPPAVTSFYASPNPIAYGTDTSLYWSSSNADGCLIDNVAWVGTSGGYYIGLHYNNTTYSIHCYKNSSGIWSGLTYTTVSVNPPPPPPPSQLYVCGDIRLWDPCLTVTGAGDYGWVQDYGIPNDWIRSFTLSNASVISVYNDWYFGGDCRNFGAGTQDYLYYNDDSSDAGQFPDMAISSFRIGSGC